MLANEYQRLAARTINRDLTREEMEMHSLHGIVGEIGEIHSIYQKVYQGHESDKEHLKKELGDLTWFIAEYCTANGWEFSEILEMNISKLRNRYPDGFTENQSVNRSPDDI